ncbi:hypothetical protein GCM10010399_90530 [Dactylosporangium fulvum]|uniref:Uncharacterized protein n=1 Tax=Dactylosporangium fulvum TaxID=53359 RepID=A0ABY5WDU5_9ACTN|nr:hypothetical protein [Dactylosporangium fulvum]UWP87118.1 hypothetical protein Dfulv_23905 [Dactylosporangium fulvum]
MIDAVTPLSDATLIGLRVPVVLLTLAGAVLALVRRPARPAQLPPPPGHFAQPPQRPGV